MRHIVVAIKLNHSTDLWIESNEVSLAHLEEYVEIEQRQVGVQESGGIDSVARFSRGQGEVE